MSLLRKILEEIKIIQDLEFVEDLGFSGKYTYSGVKRMIYGIWHNGYNERGDNMLNHMNSSPLYRYTDLIDRYSNQPEIVVKL